MNLTHAIGARTAIAAAIVFFAFPAFASAAATDITSRTAQLLPTGGNSCAAITVTSVTPYIYDGHLDSFDVVVPDSSYVAIGASVGNTMVPFNYITRRIAPDGQLRLHTDIDPIDVIGSLPVSITVLSSKNGILCAVTISFRAQGVNSIPPGPITEPAPTGGTYVPPKTPTGGNSSQGGQQVATTAPATTTPVSSLGMCAVQSGALKLWLVLLVLYIGLVAFAAFARPIVSLKNPAIPVALILVPLILLVGFWYFAPACRAGSWVPIALLIIAIAGLLAAFREQEGNMLLLPSMQRPPMPMPASTIKSKTSVTTTTTTTTKPLLTADTAKPATSPKNPHMETIQKRLDEVKKNQPPQNTY